MRTLVQERERKRKRLILFIMSDSARSVLKLVGRESGKEKDNGLRAERGRGGGWGNTEKEAYVLAPQR